MKTIAMLGPVLALAANVGTGDETEKTFDSIERHVRSTVADAYGEEFDVVGFADDLSDEEIVGVIRGRAARGAGFGRQPGGRSAGRQGGGGGRQFVQRGGYPGHGGMPGYGHVPPQLAQHAQMPGMVPGPMGMMMPGGTPNPPWFQSALGVSPPMELMNVLPLTPETNSGVFSPTVTNIKYSARPQRPFRGERPVATPVKSAGVTTATTLVCQPIFVGVIPQAVEIGTTDIGEWAPTAFGVRLAMTDAAQGTLVSVQVSVAGTAIPAGETITLSAITFYGRALA